MADVVIANDFVTTAADTIEIVYTSPSSSDGTLITAFAAVNNSGANASYKAYIYDSSGTATNALVPLKVIVRNRFDTSPTSTNQLIPAGGTLRVETSAAGAINFRISGVQL